MYTLEYFCNILGSTVGAPLLLFNREHHKVHRARPKVHRVRATSSSETDRANRVVQQKCYYLIIALPDSV